MRRKLHLLFILLFALPMGMLAQGTTWTEATQLPLGQEKSGQLSTDRTQEWWKFTVTEDGAAKIMITPGSGLRVNDVRLYYYNADFTNYWERTSNIFHFDPSWYYGELSVPDLTPGTYLLKVNRGEGEAKYALKVEFTANTYTNNKEVDGWNPNGDEKPCTLPFNTPVQGHLGYGYKTGGDDERDWYTFTVTTDGEANINIKHEGTLRISDLRLYYFNAEKTNYWERNNHNYHIDPSWYEGNLTIPNLAPGTYLIKLTRGEGYGGYELTYTFKPSSYANNKEEDGWNPTGDAKPCTLPLNTPVQGHLGYGYEGSDDDYQDWWVFEVPQDGAVNLNIKPETTSLRIDDLRLYYFNAEETNYWERTNHNFHINPSWYEGNLNIPNMAPGKYLVKIHRGEGYGGYELTYTLEAQACANDPEPNNEWKDGLANNYLARGQEKQAHLGYGYQGSDEDNVDFYRITVPRDGKVNIIYTPADVNSALRVSDIRFYYLNSDVTNYWERTSNTFHIDPGWYAGTLTVPDVAPGDYLVKVTRNEGYGAYTLKYVFEQDPLPNDGQAENDWKKPTTLPEGTTLSGHLGYGYNNSRDDEDWYEVTMARDGTLTINIEPGTNLRIDDVRLYYYNSDKTNYWERTKGNFHINPGWYFGSLITEDVETGDYLIKVHRGEGHGNYRIAFNADLKDVEPLKPLEDEEVEPGPGPDPQPGSDVINEFTLWYTLDTGGTVGYKLSEKPQVRLLGAETTVTSSRGVMTFETMKIWKFTLSAGGATAIEETVAPVQPEAEGSVSRGDDALVFNGCHPGEPVYIYTTGGRLVSQHRISSDGSLELSLGSLRPGLYIVKAGSVNIKFMKK